MNPSNKHIHLIGIGGAGISAIARVLLVRGFVVSGSDQHSNRLTAALEADGATVFVGHAAENIHGAEEVVRSSAVPDSNPEVVEMEREAGVGEAADALWDRLEARLADAIENGTYIQATHRAACERCNAHVASPDLEPFKAYAPYTLSEAGAATFLERWDHPDAESWCYRPGTAVDPLEDYMPALIRFIQEHVSHGVRIDLTTG